ncbi:actin-related protein 8 [Actinidia rufa]|uniref:Actin-related protein 8 n=1 Tax=Actinidia rufa TaxID=165716 RepID=A0A7J0DJ09_9ERIC|nr:actin-related protein 8 [Actinidia rufa]
MGKVRPEVWLPNQHNRCYVAFDYEAELSKDTQASFEVAAEGWFTLSKERFQTGEILFQPRITRVQVSSLFTPCYFVQHVVEHSDRMPLGKSIQNKKVGVCRAMSLHQAVALCMDCCQAAELTGDGSWFKTVVLAEGSACLPGLAGKCQLSRKVRVATPGSSSPVRVHWNQSNFASLWCGFCMVWGKICQ